MGYVDGTLVASGARTANGDSGKLDAVALFGVVPGELRVQLDVTAVAGTAPTLDVKVQDSVDGTTWNDLFNYTQVTGVTREVKNHTTPFGRFLRVVWTLGGATPSFTYSVKAVGK